MITKNLNIRYLIAIYTCLLFTIQGTGQGTATFTNWQQYTNSDDVGFSQEALNTLQLKLENTNTASLLVIYKGHVLFSYGDNTRKYMIHSIRKSIMNAMIGIEIENKVLKLEQTLAELNIDDIGQLTPQEKKATLKDLLSARSGIYHPSAYSTRGMIKNLPQRGSHAPGSFWYYNNWDFNTLLSIYEQQTGKKFFEAFEQEIAKPIGMEDFKLKDTYYRLEQDKSKHPAYLFRMSARDMARFGLLYLNNGAWKEKQIIPSQWVKKSTQPVSTEIGNFTSRGAYGLLWWVSKFENKEVYYASGLGGHRIMVFPNDDIVLVHRVNTYENKSVDLATMDDMVSQLLKAKTEGDGNSDRPQLMPYQPKVTSGSTTFSGSMDQYLGTYRHRYLGEMTIKKENNGYILQNAIGIFTLHPISENSFYPEDLQSRLIMKKASEGHLKFTIEPQMDENKSLTAVIFYY
ncbi:MAG: serine hydrolase [Bacteroidota bacterium]